MSRSYRTRPKQIIAKDRMARDSEGEIQFPRIAVRKPKLGDIHPLDRKFIAKAYKRLPIEYFYGLKEIELRPRCSEIGSPFGKYSPSAKKIILYSVPSIWIIDKPTRSFLSSLNRYYAKITKTETGIIAEWEEELFLSMYFLRVFFHELGHHYMHQYKCKQKPPLDVYLNEWHADAQVVKLQKRVFRKRID